MSNIAVITESITSLIEEMSQVVEDIEFGLDIYDKAWSYDEQTAMNILLALQDVLDSEEFKQLQTIAKE